MTAAYNNILNNLDQAVAFARSQSHTQQAAPPVVSAFGNNTSAFGKQPTSFGGSAFGSTSTQPVSAFGQTSKPSAFGGSAFGQTNSPAAGVSAFAKPATTSAFGAFASNATKSAFGQASAFGNPQTPSAFGTTSSTQAKPGFGGTSFSAFGRWPILTLYNRLCSHIAHLRQYAAEHTVGIRRIAAIRFWTNFSSYLCLWSDLCANFCIRADCGPKIGIRTTGNDQCNFSV